MNNALNRPPCSPGEIASQLCAFLRENLLAQEVEVQPETHLDQIGVDSFSLMELILFIERSYGLVMPPESLTADNIATVNALSNCCVKLLTNPDG